MNKNQRRWGRVSSKRNFTQGPLKNFKPKDDIEEVLPPKTTRYQFNADKLMTNRCCYIRPEQKDFGQWTELETATDQYQNILKEQYYGYDPVPDSNEVEELKKALCSIQKVETSSQYIDTDYEPAKADSSRWQSIHSGTNGIEKYLLKKNAITKKISVSQRIHISDIPRVKIIAEKFSRFKKYDVELRKLDEKVVCVEYDVHDLDRNPDMDKPIQKMRAFFSVKPKYSEGPEGNVNITDMAIPSIPSSVKHTFKIVDEDLHKFDEKEIEIIDGKISENQPYLDDLRRVLKRQKVITAKKNKTSLDLMSLYETAKKESPSLNEDFSHTNLLSKAELDEVKDLIMKKCASSVHGISRRVVKNKNHTEENSVCVISQSIVNELLKEVENF